MTRCACVSVRCAQNARAAAADEEEQEAPKVRQSFAARSDELNLAVWRACPWAWRSAQGGRRGTGQAKGKLPPAKKLKVIDLFRSTVQGPPVLASALIRTSSWHAWRTTQAGKQAAAPEDADTPMATPDEVRPRRASPPPTLAPWVVLRVTHHRCRAMPAGRRRDGGRRAQVCCCAR